MKEKKTRKWRRVYKYVCSKCEKRRIAFSFELAKGKVCTLCKKDIPDPNQPPLFPATENKEPQVKL